MFLYIVASAYTVHMLYWMTKSAIQTLRVLHRIARVAGGALEIAHTALELKQVIQLVSYPPAEEPVDDNGSNAENTMADVVADTEPEIEPSQPSDEPSLTLVVPDETIMNETYSDVSLSDTYSDLEVDILDEIAEEEDLFVEDEKRDGQYYLGHYFVSELEEDAIFPLFLLVAIQSQTFLKYPYHFIEKYMELYIPVPQKQLEIMCTCIRYDNQYRLVNVVLKTHWIRLIQRHWKRTYAQRKRVLIARMSPYSTMHYSFTGRYPEGYNTVPSLHGMLSVYSPG
jgi:hypothetical protein